jgi:glutamate-1-semialdehyde 2,1-aminomutase
VWDVDGNEYIDYLGSWGPLILGHAPAAVVRAVTAALKKGSSFGAPTLLELELAGLVKGAFPSIKKMRFVSSGTEATMSAIRVARGFAKRDLVVKFIGNYHGHVDGLLVQAGSGLATFGVPSSPGVPADFARNTIAVRYNDLDAVRAVCRTKGRQIACLIVEPVAGNVGVIPPAPGFLAGLRELTAQHGIVLVFDEVITGFRVAFGGAQGLYGVTPDMTCLGKIIGGGLPVGCYGGREEIMDCVSPVGRVYQAGTLSGNPLAMAAGIAMLKVLRDGAVYRRLEETSGRLAEGLAESARKAGVAISQTRVGSMMATFFTDRPIRTYDDVKTSDAKRYAWYFHAMLRRGVYLAPSQFEAAFVSAAHTKGDVERTASLSAEAMKEL